MHIIDLSNSQPLDSKSEADILLTAAYWIQKHERCYILLGRAKAQKQLPSIGVWYSPNAGHIRSFSDQFWCSRVVTRQPSSTCLLRALTPVGAVDMRLDFVFIRGKSLTWGDDMIVPYQWWCHVSLNGWLGHVTSWCGVKTNFNFGEPRYCE